MAFSHEGYTEIFLPNTRGPLGCLLGFWPSGPKPCGGNYECSRLVSSKFLETARKLCFETFWISSSLLRIQKTLSRFQRMKAEFITTVIGVLSSSKNGRYFVLLFTKYGNRKYANLKQSANVSILPIVGFPPG